MPGHDVIVIGASAGGIDALMRLVSRFPADLPAAVFVVVHIPSHVRSRLPEILSRKGPLPATHARHGAQIAHGCIYVAPPDFHLILRADSIELSHGPRENYMRPAIDSLFRSAARAFGTRVVGVVLSGTLDDGSTGMMIVRAHGGTCIVQDPEEALFGEMPRAALQHTAVDYVLPVHEIAETLHMLAQQPDEERGGTVMQDPAEAAQEAIEQAFAEQVQGRRAGDITPYTCPECGGALWQIQDERFAHFECHVGHTFGPSGLLQVQSEILESALWRCVRMLREKATLTRQLAARARTRGDEIAALRIDEQAELDEQHMSVIQDTLLVGISAPTTQVAAVFEALDDAEDETSA
jgi:two-component system chemotaxis response regulator CheB